MLVSLIICLGIIFIVTITVMVLDPGVEIAKKKSRLDYLEDSVSGVQNIVHGYKYEEGLEYRCERLEEEQKRILALLSEVIDYTYGGKK